MSAGSKGQSPDERGPASRWKGSLSLVLVGWGRLVPLPVSTSDTFLTNDTVDMGTASVIGAQNGCGLDESGE